MNDSFHNSNESSGLKKAADIERLKSALTQADAVIIGAGAGLSASAGYDYSGGRFETYFADFKDKYGFQDMYSGGFYAFASPEERWAYWSRYVYINRYMPPPNVAVYENLRALVQDKDYFVITTNVDHCFQKAAFAKDRLFYTQGDFGLFQCSVPCHKATYDNFDWIKAMVKAQGFSILDDGTLTAKGDEKRGKLDFRKIKMRIPSELIPLCPVCRKPMAMHLRSDGTFVENDDWQTAHARYRNFLTMHLDGKICDIFERNAPRGGEKRSTLQNGRNGAVLFLELGVGQNTPGIIKYPFWTMTAQNPNARYVCINAGGGFIPPEIRDSSLCIDGDIGNTLKAVLQH
ncbi:MAG: SIR2 family NAD-dependent protein deacylase [Treponema sp.]